MNCSTCGRPLPAEAMACPNCGTVTPFYYSQSGSSPYSPTYAASAEVSKPPMPPTNYGSGPSNIPSAGYAANPYEVAPPPLPTPTPKKGSAHRRAYGIGCPPGSCWINRDTPTSRKLIWDHTGPAYCWPGAACSYRNNAGITQSLPALHGVTGAE